jgi:hypothetical protein
MDEVRHSKTLRQRCVSTLARELQKGSSGRGKTGSQLPKNHILKETIVEYARLMVSAIVLALCAYIIIIRVEDRRAKDWAFGVIGLILGYWLSP